MSENIVKTLEKQHQDLLRLVTEIIDLSKGEIENVGKVVDNLKQFGSDLETHVDLENEVFYPGLLKKMKDHNMNTVDTERFIGEMRVLGEVVMKFLTDYNNVEIIESNKNEFKDRFRDISEKLILRIEAEESGVFTIWSAYDK